MGRDKAMLTAGASTLIEKVAAQMKAAAGSATVVGGGAEYESLGLPVIGEDFGGCGPLSGIEAALRAVPEGWAAIAACDMPGLTADWIRHLIALAGEGSGVDAVVSESASSRLEPLCAVYHARLHADVRKALLDKRLAVRDLLASWRVMAVRPADEAALTNINTPEEWAAWNR
jgi:molybdopterin-guanine dinucleotide biosynthesis protein A